MFPNDPTETLDFDFDGIGNNADLDDDNDGVEDLFDLDPLNALLTIIPDQIPPLPITQMEWVGSRSVS